jgi:hypothetical protein
MQALPVVLSMELMTSAFFAKSWQLSWQLQQFTHGACFCV